jgi:hypothetical protein
MEWQPIESAPKDGAWILGLFGCFGVRQMKWWDGGGSYSYHWMAFGKMTPYNPTHWMPLPPAPETTQ